MCRGGRGGAVSIASFSTLGMTVMPSTHHFGDFLSLDDPKPLIVLSCVEKIIKYIE